MKPASTVPFTVVRFFVQPWCGAPEQYRCRGEAERALHVAARRTSYAALYRVVGEPATDLWGSPELIAECEGERAAA